MQKKKKNAVYLAISTMKNKPKVDTAYTFLR